VSPYRTLDDVVEGLEALETSWAARGDRRAIFATVYRLMSAEMYRRVSGGIFRDGEWVRRYTVAFANLYREALDAYGAGRPVPRSWRIAFDTAVEGSALVTQDLLLGINAHVNHDLALALEHVGIDPDRAGRLVDHTAVNEVMRALTDDEGARVSALYARGLTAIDDCAGTLDESISNFSLVIARANAWEAAVALANARSELERTGVRTLLDVRASVIARLILAPSLKPHVLEACRRIEAGRWLELTGRKEHPHGRAV
jgi:hypothetical protein